MQLEPWHDAVLMIDVSARHLLGLRPNLKRIPANSTLGIIRCQELRRDQNIWKPQDSGLSSRRSAIAVRIILSELLNELLEARTNEVVTKVSASGERRGALKDDLDVGAASREGVEVVLQEGQGIEGLGAVEAGDGREAVRIEKISEIGSLVDIEAGRSRREEEGGGGCGEEGAHRGGESEEWRWTGRGTARVRIRVRV